jgi:putative endopeptidase
MTIDESAFDPAVLPQDSFYHFVNGTWLKTVQIPAERSSISTFVELDDKAKNNLKQIFDELAHEKEGENLIAEFYLCGMNEAAIEGQGLESIQDLLDKIKAISSAADAFKVISFLQSEGTL